MSRNLSFEISQVTLIAHGENLLALIRSFPIDSLKAQADNLSLDEQRLVRRLWAVYLEAGD